MIFMRTHMKTFMWVTICLVVPSFVATFGYYGLAQRQAQRPILIVNGVEYSEQAFQNQLNNIRNQYRERLGDDYDAANLDDELVRRQALNGLINQAIIGSKVKDLGLSSTDAEVSVEIRRIFTSQETGQFVGNDVYVNTLVRQGVHPRAYEESVRGDLTVRKLQDLIGKSVLVTGDELRDAFDQMNETVEVAFVKWDVSDYIGDVTTTEEELRQYYEEHKERFTKHPMVKLGYTEFNPASFSAQVEPTTPELQVYYEQNSQNYREPPAARAEYIRFDAKRFRDLVTVTPEDVDQYYDAHKDEFTRPEQRKARYVAVDVEALAGNITISTAETRAYYEENRQRYGTPERVGARSILVRVPEGADEAVVEVARQRALAVMQSIGSGSRTFEIAAMEESQGQTGNRGGDLGVLERGTMSPAFDDAAFALAVGEATGPVRTPDGFRLIKVYRHDDEKVTPYADLESEIARLLRNRSSQEDARARLTGLREAIGPAGLSGATVADFPVRETDYFTLNEREVSPEIGEDSFQFVRAVFQMEPGERALSPVVEGVHKDFLVELVDVQASRPMTRDEAGEAARQRLVDERAALYAKSEAQAVLDMIRSATDGWARARIEHATWLTTTRLFKPTDYLAEFGTAAEDFKRQVLASRQGQFGGPVEGRDAAFLFYVVEKQEERIPDLSEVVGQVREEYRSVQRGEIASDAAQVLFGQAANGAHPPGTLEEMTRRLAESRKYPIEYKESEPFRREEPIFTEPRFAKDLAMLQGVGDVNSSVLRNIPPMRQQQEVDEEAFPISRVVVMQLLAEYPQRIPAFEDVRGEVEERVLLERAAPLAEAAARETLGKVREYLASGQGRGASGEIDLTGFAWPQGKFLLTTESFTRWQAPRSLGRFPLLPPLEFNRTAFEVKTGETSGVVPVQQMVHPFWKGDRPEDLGSPLEWPKDTESYAILYEVRHSTPTDEEFEEQKDQVHRQLEAQKTNTLFEEWLRRQNEQADVVVRVKSLVDLVKDRKSHTIDLYGDQKKETS